MKIGVMNNPTKSIYDEAIAFGKAGFDFIDLTIEGPQAMDVNTEKMGPILKHYNLALTGHTDPCLPWAYPVRSIRQACLDELERCARIFSALGAGIMNIHPCYFCPPAMKGSLVELNIEALMPVVEMAFSLGLKIAFENFIKPFDRISTFKALIGEVPGLTLHLDVGHANLGKDNHEAFCKHLGKHIAHVHFSDNRGKADNHMPLGVGNINWKNAVDALKATGYDGTITLEVFCDNPQMRFQYLNLSRKYLLALWQ
ncbi:MAG: sugar phosphate isomerase/epimerase family protein [Desulfobacterales bacterium]